RLALRGVAPAGRFDRVTPGVAEIQQDARALLLRVGGHHARLHLSGERDRGQERARLATQQPARASLDVRDRRFVDEKGGLDDLRDAGRALTTWQRRDRAGIA